MLRPDRLGLVGCLLIFVLSFVFQNSDSSGRHNAAPERWEPRRPAISDTKEQRRPRRVGPKQTLPAVSSGDPTLKLMPSVKGNSTGTAFSIGKGVWMTARHVIEGCNKFGIKSGPKKISRGQNPVINPFHDLAIFDTSVAAPNFSFDKENLFLGQDGFHFGYPQGKPAAIHSSLLGRANINPGRRTRHKEPVLAWAEISRVPNFSGSLGGISGGPVINKDGEIIGVSVVEARRRGRIFTAAPVGLADMLRRDASYKPTDSGIKFDIIINGQQFFKFGESLRRKLAVSKVFCWVQS